MKKKIQPPYHKAAELLITNKSIYMVRISNIHL